MSPVVIPAAAETLFLVVVSRPYLFGLSARKFFEFQFLARTSTHLPLTSFHVLSLTITALMSDILRRMDVERIIDEIEQLQGMFEAPDIRPLSPSDLAAANRRHDE
jgi:hypothetical protein